MELIKTKNTFIFIEILPKSAFLISSSEFIILVVECVTFKPSISLNCYGFTI